MLKSNSLAVRALLFYLAVFAGGALWAAFRQFDFNLVEWAIMSTAAPVAVLLIHLVRKIATAEIRP